MDKQSIIEAHLLRPAEASPNPSCRRSPGPSTPTCPSTATIPDKARRSWTRPAGSPVGDGMREKNGVRLEFINSTTAGNHVREQAQQLLQQNWIEIGAKMTINNLPAAVMWGDYWMMSKFETAMVGIGFMIGPGPGRDRLLRQPLDRRPGRRRAEHDPVRQPGGRHAACGRRGDGRPGQAQGGLPEDAGRSCATTCRTCRSSSTRWCPGHQGGAGRLHAQRERPGELLERRHLVLGELTTGRPDRTDGRTSCKSRLRRSAKWRPQTWRNYLLGRVGPEPDPALCWSR